MRLILDTTRQTLVLEMGADTTELPLYSSAAFAALSHQWMRVGWSLKHTYTFTWLGRPIIQLPEDLLRLQEVITALRPAVIVETGVAHGGSLVFCASLCRLLGTGRVIGVEVALRPHNRSAIEQHPLADLITLVDGSSIAPAVVARVYSLVAPGESVLVLLDSDHSRSHVLAELRAYQGLVTPGSYLVVMDGIMPSLTDVPGGRPEWDEDNPLSAIREFLAERPDFSMATPTWRFNESALSSDVTHWPTGWLLRLR